MLSLQVILSPGKIAKHFTSFKIKFTEKISSYFVASTDQHAIKSVHHCNKVVLGFNRPHSQQLLADVEVRDGERADVTVIRDRHLRRRVSSQQLRGVHSLKGITSSLNQSDIATITYTRQKYQVKEKDRADRLM